MRHPVEVLADRFGPHGAAFALGAAVLLALAGTDSTALGVGAIGAAFALAVTAPVELFPPGADDGELATARDAYVDGEITLSEFEDRAEVILDDRAVEIRRVVEAVNGIGPATSATLALRYDSVEALTEAVEAGEVEDVLGVGPARSEALAVELGGR